MSKCGRTKDALKDSSASRYGAPFVKSERDWRNTCTVFISTSRLALCVTMPIIYLRAELWIVRKHKYKFIFNITRKWDGAGTMRNSFPWKIRTSGYYIVNIMSADELVIQEARTPAAMVITLFLREYSSLCIARGKCVRIVMWTFQLFCYSMITLIWKNINICKIPE